MNVMQSVIRSVVCAAATAAAVLSTAMTALPQQPSQPGTAPRPSPAARAAPITRGDKAFIDKVAEGGRAEVQLGRLAEDKAADQGVKDFGRRMVEDHGKANRELSELAARKGLEPTAEIGKQSGLYERLSKLAGREFDREYVREMVKDHRADVAEFKRMSDKAADPDLKAWVAKTLPTLEEHLRMIEGLRNRVSASKT